MFIGKDELGGSSGRSGGSDNKNPGDFDDVGLEEQGQAGGTTTTRSNNPSGTRTTQLSRAESERNIHDQLPDIEEYKTSQQQSGRGGTTTTKKVILIVVSMIVVACILIGVGVHLGKESAKNNNNDMSDEIGFIPDSPEPAPAASSERANDITTFVINMGWANSTAVKTPNSPQWRAVQWLANSDPMQLPISIEVEFMNRYVLATLYYALDGDQWSYKLNFLTKHSVCDWNTLFDTTVIGVDVDIGITCYDGDSIVEIFLPNMELRGELPTEIGLLYDLENINLFQNEITGKLPDSLGDLDSLQSLILHNNKFRGTIPTWITKLTNLQTLNLATNRFYGSLPAEIGSTMESLRTLSLENNDLAGDLSSLKGLSTLDALYLGNNDFRQGLGNDIFDTWSEIQVMDMSENQLTGEIPSLLFASGKLVVVDLSANLFTGSIPRIVDKVHTKIEFLALYDNRLSGTIDKSLLGLSKLAHLDLSKNEFTGELPTFLSTTSTLKYLFLAYNEKFIPGSVPAEYAMLDNLVDLSLQKTNRIGHIPTQFGLMHKLVLLDLNLNKITGPIPTEIGKLSNLRFLLLQGNQLHGVVPTAITKLVSLDTLLIDGNKFSGGANNICQLSELTLSVASCSVAFDCTCCTKCCRADDVMNCNQTEWYTGVDPSAEGGYVRDNYVFHEANIVFPAANNSAKYYDNFTGYYQTPP